MLIYIGFRCIILYKNRATEIPSIIILTQTRCFVKHFYEFYFHFITEVIPENGGLDLPNYLSAFNSNMLSEVHNRYIAHELVSLNETTAEYGITLSEKDCAEIAEFRAETLKDNERIEIGVGAVRRIIEEFCDSGYISQNSFKDTVEGLLECFYTIKNETDDKIGDNEVLAFLKYLFETEAGGDVSKLYECEAFDLFISGARRKNDERGGLRSQ